MAQTQGIFDEWSPAHAVMRVQAAAVGLFNRVWNNSQAMAKWFVRNEPELANLGIRTGSLDLTVTQLKHGFRWEIAAGADTACTLVLPEIADLLAQGMRIGDVVSFWSIGTIGAPDTTQHSMAYAGAAGDTVTPYGPAFTAGTDIFPAAGSVARRVHLHITGAKTATLLVQS